MLVCRLASSNVIIYVCIHNNSGIAMSSVDKVLGSRDLSDLIASYLPAKSASRLLQAQSRSIATECRNATIDTMPNDALVRCLRYAHRTGERDLETRMRREYNRRLLNKRMDVHGVASGRSIHDVRRTYYDRFVRPDGTFDYDQFQQYLRIAGFANRIPQHHVETVLRNMFADKPDLIPMIPYLRGHPNWRHLAKLLIQRPLSDNAKRWYKHGKLMTSKVDAAVQFLRSVHTDKEKIQFAKRFDSTNIDILLDAVRDRDWNKLWTTEIPLLVAKLTPDEIGWIAEKAFFLGVNCNPLAIFRDLEPLQESRVAGFEVFVDRFPQVRKSLFADCLRHSYFAYPRDPEQVLLYNRLRDALTPWSGTRRAWIETARAASVAAHGDSAPHTLPVD